MMRQIQALLYRALCYRLADDAALAPLAWRHKVRTQFFSARFRSFWPFTYNFVANMLTRHTYLSSDYKAESV